MDYRVSEELSWYLCCSNSLWQEWSRGLVYFPGRNATDPIWRVLASSDGIFSWTPLKPQHSNPNHNPKLFGQSTLVYWLPYPSHTSYHPSQTPWLPWISKTDTRFMQDVWSIRYVSVAFFQSLKHNFIAFRSSKVSDWIFEIHQLWWSGFSRVYSNYFGSCSFEVEIIKIG